MKKLKLMLYVSAKFLGLMAVARILTAKHTRILCYHGFSYSDEHQFQGFLFMDSETFRSRMEFLKAERYPVVTLDDAVVKRAGGNTAACSTVLTFDDGWQGFSDFAAPVLLEFGFPAAVYVTTYYVSHREPVFNVFVKYCFWKTARSTVALDEIDKELQGEFDLSKHSDVQKAISVLIRFYRSSKSTFRTNLWRSVREVLLVDAPVEAGAFLLMSQQTLGVMRKDGFDLEMHTHRHRFEACTENEATQEIIENREVLSEIGCDEARHFCFPSGDYRDHQLSILKNASIVSATTTRQGLVTAKDNVLELPRIVDRQDMSLLEFEAEMSGFAHLVRLLRPRLNRT